MKCPATMLINKDWYWHKIQKKIDTGKEELTDFDKIYHVHGKIPDQQICTCHEHFVVK